MTHCRWQILIYLGLVVNSANVRHKDNTSCKKKIMSVCPSDLHDCLPIELESEIWSQVVARRVLIPGVNRLAVFLSHLPARLCSVWHDAAGIHISTTDELKTEDRLMMVKQMAAAQFESAQTRKSTELSTCDQITQDGCSYRVWSGTLYASLLPLKFASSSASSYSWTEEAQNDSPTHENLKRRCQKAKKSCQSGFTICSHFT